MERVSTGIECITVMAGLHGKHADTEQILHAFALDKRSEPDSQTIMRVAKALLLRAKKVNVSIKKLEKIPLPAIVKLEEGTYGILAKRDPQSNGWLFLDPVKGKPDIVSDDELSDLITGEIILISPKASKFKEEMFGLKWFIPAIWKYKRALKDVLVASLCMQLLGLGTPIVMQVIIDKVLVHKRILFLQKPLFPLIINSLQIIKISFYWL